jgi:UPF0042 nucleotide-binding protein
MAKHKKQPAVQLLIVTGVSGAGKTLVLQTLEDMGFFCIDNLPPSFLFQMERKLADERPAAVVIDTRAGESLEGAASTISQWRNCLQTPVHVLFLDCTDDMLLRRFKETRRPHPLSNEEPGIVKAIQKERIALAPLREIADQVLDTTLLKPRDLRHLIAEQFATGSQKTQLRVRLVSFGFKFGVPLDADLMFDVRFLKNPFYVSHLKPKDGRDPEVEAFVMPDEGTKVFLDHLHEMLDFILPEYRQEGKAQLTIAIGCTGGRHRSVVLIEHLRKYLQERGYRVSVSHRDVERQEERE